MNKSDVVVIKTKEKRKHPRILVNIEFPNNGKGSVKRPSLKIVDLSANGITLETEAELEIGSSFCLNAPIEIRGEVRHQKTVNGKIRYGIRVHRFGGVLQGASSPFVLTRPAGE